MQSSQEYRTSEMENRAMRTTNTLFEKIINRLPYAVLASAAIIVGATAAVTSGDKPKVERDAATPNVKLVVDDRPVSRDGRFGTSFAPVVKKVAPSVVKVTTSTKVKQASIQEFPGFDIPSSGAFSATTSTSGFRGASRTCPTSTALARASSSPRTATS
jgi:S1-C subfamily serine protease